MRRTARRRRFDAGSPQHAGALGEFNPLRGSVIVTHTEQQDTGIAALVRANARPELRAGAARSRMPLSDRHARQTGAHDG